MEIIVNEPYTDGPGGNGQYTYKIYHIGSHLPGKERDKAGWDVRWWQWVYNTQNIPFRIWSSGEERYHGKRRGCWCIVIHCYFNMCKQGTNMYTCFRLPVF